MYITVFKADTIFNLFKGGFIMGFWDAVKNITNKIAVDIGIKEAKVPEVRKDVINKNIEDEYGVLGVEKKHIWVFNSGLLFTGNPKWLFIYINKYRPDIRHTFSPQKRV